MLKDRFQQRFIELDEQYQKMPFRQNSGMSGTHADGQDWKKWATSAQNLIRAVFEENSPHYVNFIQAVDNCAGSD